MTNSISTPVSYQFHNDNIRVIEKGGALWFVAADVCKVLGLSNPTMALKRLDDDEYALNSIEGITKGNEDANLVNESGLYSLILGSKKKEAKEFKRWVTHDLLPTLRKTGSYTMPAQPQIDDPSTKEDREPLTSIVNTLVSVAPLSHRDVWHMVKAELKTTKAAGEFTVSEVHRAIDFVQGRVKFYTARVIPRDNDPQAGIISEMILQGATDFSLLITVSDSVSKDVSLVQRKFLARIEVNEQWTVWPAGTTFSLKKR